MRNIYLKDVGIIFPLREADKPNCLVYSVILLNPMEAKEQQNSLNIKYTKINIIYPQISKL
jgi:hypothetical protein